MTRESQIPIDIIPIFKHDWIRIDRYNEYSKLILDILHKQIEYRSSEGGLMVSEIADLTGISKPYISDVIKRLKMSNKIFVGAKTGKTKNIALWFKY